jgi:septal ring factor EnvC (AmiA/AmiB activator)
VAPLKGTIDASIKDMGYPGILILSVPNKGRTVIASEEGIVFFAGKDDKLLPDYGKLIIIFHRYGYESVYARLERIFVKSHQIVKKGEPIGTAGSWKGKRGIYFVIRKRTSDGKVYSIDPREVVRGF